jgi:hypothetical protein
MEIRKYEQSQTLSARPETIGSRAFVDYFIALHSVPHLNDIHQYSDKSTADRARVSERGACALQGHEWKSRSIGGIPPILHSGTWSCG